MRLSFASALQPSRKGETEIMRNHRVIALLSLSVLLTGGIAVISPPPAVQAASTEKRICAVCGPREGAGPEPVRATATYKGKSYAFCSNTCKVEFLKNPNEFLVTDTGKPAPAFSVKGLSPGATVSLSDFKGKVVLADFWATYCIPCVKALPELQALQQKYGPKGFSVVGLTIDENPALISRFTKKAMVTYPIGLATSKVWNAYRVNNLPSLVLIGRDGKIIRRFGGEADKKLMEAEIAKAVGGSG
jgi:thiol-disulfide isomerase/thioredoxin